MPNKPKWPEIMRDRGFIPVAEAAEIARVHRATVYRWIEQDEIAINAEGRSNYVSFRSLCAKLGPSVCAAYGIQNV